MNSDTLRSSMAATRDRSSSIRSVMRVQTFSVRLASSAI